MKTVTAIGLDIAKSVFQVHGVDAAGKAVIRRQLGVDRVHAQCPIRMAIFQGRSSINSSPLFEGWKHLEIAGPNSVLTFIGVPIRAGSKVPLSAPAR